MKIIVLLFSLVLTSVVSLAQQEKYFFNTQEEKYGGKTTIRRLDSELVIDYSKKEFKLFFLEDEEDYPKDKILEIRKPNKYLTIFIIDSWGNGKYPPREVKLYKSPDGWVTLTMGAMVYSYQKNSK